MSADVIAAIIVIIVLFSEIRSQKNYVAKAGLQHMILLP
jgi:hypothetical protein